MRRHVAAVGLLALVQGLACSMAWAQPAMVVTGMPTEDLSADGRTWAGPIFDFSLERYDVFRFVRGSGIQATGAHYANGEFRMSADASAMSFGWYNIDNYGGFTYDPPTAYNQTTIAHRWTAATGAVNIGLPADGNICGYDINTAADISGNGRFVVGAGWSSRECGPFRAWIYDSQTGQFTVLPTSQLPEPAFNTRANAVSFDGSVIVGYDENLNSTGEYRLRRACVWVRDGASWTQTILDADGGDAIAVNAPGTAITGLMSFETMQSTFGTPDSTPILWDRIGSANAWAPRNLGGTPGMTPTAISDDAQTVVGSMFIWKPSLNDGMAMDLEAYITSLGGSFPNFTFGAPFGPPVAAANADCTALLVRGSEAPGGCLSPFLNAILYLDGTECEVPRVNFQPQSQEVEGYNPGEFYFGIISNAFISGSWPITYQWQKADAENPGNWINLSDDNCEAFEALGFDVRGALTPQLRLGFLSDTWQGTYRCVVNNSCGSLTTDEINIVPPVCGCAADFNRDGGVDGGDVEAFFTDWALATGCSDTNRDGGVDGGDVEAFFVAWENGGC